MNNWILFLISAGALSLAMFIKFTFPVSVTQVLSPLYLHILVNGIIITIAASTRFLQTRSESPLVQSQHLISVKTPPPAYYADYSPQPEEILSVVHEEHTNEEDRVLELKAVMVNGSQVVDLETEEETAVNPEPGAETAFLDWKSTYESPQPESFSSDDRSEYISAVNLIGDAPEIPPEATHETLESVWKKITKGQSRAACETVRHVAPPPENVPKSKSLKERSIDSYSPPSSTIWKEVSPSQDELNRRVEAFIKKVNDEIRLRGQE